MPLYRSLLSNALGATPDNDAAIYIASAGITKMQQQVGIHRLVLFLKAQSLWTSLNGGFIFGNDVQKSGSTLIDLKAGTSATVTGGVRGQGGILLSGATADQISFGARTFTNNYMPSTYLMFAPFVRATTTSSNRINFGPLSQQSTYRGFQPHTHGQTGSNTSILFQAYRGDGNRYYQSTILGGDSSLGSFVGAAFSSGDQKLYGAGNSQTQGGASTTPAATTLSFAAGATWLLGPFENGSTTSTEITMASACFFWDSNTTLTQANTIDLDCILRSFAL
jgi:hypothetical protein